MPIGLVLIPLARRRLSESFGPRPQLDIVGLILAGAGVLGLTWGLVRASAAGWASGEVLAALLLGGALVVAFLGLGWVALIAQPGMGYLGLALTIAGVGTSMCFPTVANAVFASVPLAEAGVASSTRRRRDSSTASSPRSSSPPASPYSRSLPRCSRPDVHAPSRAPPSAHPRRLRDRASTRSRLARRAPRSAGQLRARARMIRSAPRGSSPAAEGGRAGRSRRA